VSRDPRGVFVLLTLLDLLSERIWDDQQNCEPALQVGGGGALEGGVFLDREWEGVQGAFAGGGESSVTSKADE